MAAQVTQQLSSASLEDACDDDDVYEVCTHVAIVRKTHDLDSPELAAVPRGARNLLLEGDLGKVSKHVRRVRWRVGRDEGFVSRRCVRPVSWKSICRRTGRARWRLDVSDWRPVRGEQGREWAFLMDLIPEPSEKERIGRFHHASDRYKALVSRLCARRVCAVCLGLEDATVEIGRTKGKKPFLLRGGSDEKPNFNFNVSHDGRHVVVAAEPLTIVGVDVCAPHSERKGGGEHDLEAMRDMLTAREWAWLDVPERAERFRLLWSGKEAFAKARGDGLGFEFKRLDLVITQVKCKDGRRLFAGKPIVDGVSLEKEWRIHLEIFEDGHVFAAARGPVHAVVDAHGLFKATLRKQTVTCEELDNELHLEWTPLSIVDLVPDDQRRAYLRCVDNDERSLAPPPPALSPDSTTPGSVRYQTSPPPPGGVKKGSGVYVSEAPMDCQWAVYGRDDDYRASCAKDGCVTNNRGMILGYLTETQAGSASEEFLGELEPDATGSALNALDGQDTHILTLHLDGCRLVSLEGSTLCEVDRSGRILGPRSQVLGEVRPFSYAMQREVALYLCFLDPGLLDSLV